jgi:site-specific DNA recombinase
MNLIAYCRCSTDEQVRDGSSLDTQAASIRRWAAENKHALLGLFTDEGVSGTIKIVKRPAGRLAMQAIANGAQGIVAVDQDRYSRSASHWLEFVADMTRHGKDIYTVRNGNRPLAKTATDKLQSSIAASVAQYGRDTIAERTRETLAQIKQEGRRYGSVPLTAILVRGKLVNDERMIEAARLADALQKQGLSLRRIGDTLVERGYPSRTQSGVWNPAEVKSLIRQRDGWQGVDGPLMPRVKKAEGESDIGRLMLGR